MDAKPARSARTRGGGAGRHSACGSVPAPIPAAFDRRRSGGGEPRRAARRSASWRRRASAALPIIGELELGWRAMEARHHRDHRDQRQDDHHRADRRAAGRAAAARCSSPATSARRWPRTRSRFAADGLIVAARCRASSSRPSRPSSRGWPWSSTSRPIISTGTARSRRTWTPRPGSSRNQTSDRLRRAQRRRRGRRARWPRGRGRTWCGSAGARCSAHGVFVRDGWIVARLNGHVEEICPLSEICAARPAQRRERAGGDGVRALARVSPPSASAAAIGRFRGVAHRIEFVRELDGVQYYNDSKGTNVASTLRALESFAERDRPHRRRQGQGPGLGAAGRGRARARRPRGRSSARTGRGSAPRSRGAGIPVTSAATMQAAIDAARARPRAGRRRPALAGVRLVRHVRQLRAPRRRLQAARGASRLMRIARQARADRRDEAVGGSGGGAALAPPHVH